MSFGRYALVVLGVTLLSQLMAAPWLDARARAAAALGAGLAVLNTWLAYFLALWSRPKPTKLFLAAVLWGTAGRLAFLLAAVLAAVLAFGMARVPLAISLLAYFLGFLIFELSLLHKTTRATPAMAP